MTTAKQVPALVLAHQDYLRGQGYHQYASRFFDSIAGAHTDSHTSRDSFTKEQRHLAGDRWATLTADILNVSRLFHVSDSMAEVAKIAAERLSPDETWQMELLPSLHGVLVFEKPVELMDVWSRLVTVTALQWTTDVKSKFLSLSYYTDVTTPQDHYNQILAMKGDLDVTRRLTGLWALSHVEGIPFGTRLGSFFTEDDKQVIEYKAKHKDTTEPELVDRLEPVIPGKRPIFGNISNLLFGIFALMDQTITSISEETDKRMARMVNKRRNQPPPMVTVIQLRRKENHGYHEEGTGRWLNYRSMVSMHFRRQHYKDGSVRRILINTYIRGPEDAPFYQPKRVNTLAR